MFETETTRNKSLLERVVFEASVEFATSQKDTRFGHSEDLSVGGLYLRTEHRLWVNDTIKLSFSFADHEKETSISCNARVAWTNYKDSKRKPHYPSGVGLQFEGLLEETFSSLETFIDRYDEVKKMNVVCAWCGCPLGQRKGPHGKTSHGICSQCSERI